MQTPSAAIRLGAAISAGVAIGAAITVLYQGRRATAAPQEASAVVATAPELVNHDSFARQQQPASTEDDGELLHGRAKHDMTPGQLAKRQHTDPLISLMLDLIDRYSLAEACAIAEDLIADHLIEVLHRPDAATELSALAPRLVSNEFGRLWQPLHLREALIDYDSEAHVTCRQYVPATFRELRNICNLAQVRPAVAAPLQLLTFDGDKTLYPDRETLSADAPLVPLLLHLLRRGVTLALVTAVGFDTAKPYEDRLCGLLGAISSTISDDATSPDDAPPLRELCGRLFVVGGQCNYLARCVCRGGKAALEMVPGKEWRLPEMQRWQPAHLQRLLDVAQV